MHKISKFCTSEAVKVANIAFVKKKVANCALVKRLANFSLYELIKLTNSVLNTSNLCTSENASKLSTSECIKLANQNGSSVSRLSLGLWGIKGQVDVTAAEWWWHNLDEHVYQLAAEAVAIYNTKLLFCSFQVTQ